MSGFNFQPILSGKKVSLRPLVEHDFDALYAIANDPLLWEQHPQSDRYKLEVFQEFFAQAIQSKGAFVVIDKQNNQIIGSTRYCNFNEAQNEIEVGYTFIARNHWGKGFNHDLKDVMINYAFEYAERVVFYVGEYNYRSRKALEKIGAVQFFQALIPDCRRGCEIVYKVEKHTWVSKVS